MSWLWETTAERDEMALRLVQRQPEAELLIAMLGLDGAEINVVPDQVARVARRRDEVKRERGSEGK